jgi:hypothetical protein
MGGRSDGRPGVLKQLNFYKSHLSPSLGPFLKALAQDEVGKYAYVFADSWRDFAEGLKCEPRSLEKAAQFFGLDHTSAIGRSVLAAILADIIFSTRSAGRRRGATTWDDDRLVLLGRKYSELKSENPTLRKGKIVGLICEDKEFKEYRDHPRAIYVKLKEASRAFERRKRLHAQYRNWVREEQKIAKNLEAHKKAGYPDDPAN